MKKLYISIFLTGIVSLAISQYYPYQKSLPDVINSQETIEKFAGKWEDNYTQCFQSKYLAMSQFDVGKYHETGEKLDSLIWEGYNEMNEWELSSKNEYTYDGIGNRTSNIISNRNIDNTNWVYKYKYEYMFTAENNIAS